MIVTQHRDNIQKKTKHQSCAQTLLPNSINRMSEMANLASCNDCVFPISVSSINNTHECIGDGKYP